MISLNIGIDVDGVLVDLENYQLKHGKKYFSEKFGKNVINANAYDIEQIFGCTHEQREKFWQKYIWEYCLTEPVIINASEIISKLHNDGHKIVIITGRVYTTKRGFMCMLFRSMLKYWLRKNNIVYDDIVFCSEKESSTDKYNACIEKDIDVMIDDKPENLLGLANKIEVICYPAAWNKETKDERFINVNNWKDIYECISAMEKS